MATNKNGLVYYKLETDIYPGDKTKGCGLRGEEIDGNFHFLRGQDIKNIYFDENGTLFINKNNGVQLSATQTPHNYDFSYNTDTGELKIIKPDGEEVVLEGFKQEHIIYHDNTLTGDGKEDTPLGLSPDTLNEISKKRNIYHDSNLTGNGEQDSPFKLNNIVKPGTHQPVLKVFDTTINESLPFQNIDINERYLTKEYHNCFGGLYPLSVVIQLQEELERKQSPWRLPTKDEWDTLFSAIDCASQEHSHTTVGSALGDFAGSALKSIDFWYKNTEEKLLSENAYGFSVYPVGYAGAQGTASYDGFGQRAAYWAAPNIDSENEWFIKEFTYDTEGIVQHRYNIEEFHHLSIRLVRDFDENFDFQEYDTVEGQTVKCIHIPGQNLIWTGENLLLPQNKYAAFLPEVWFDHLTENELQRYVINDWNGLTWDHTKLEEGESLVISKHGGFNNHEWRLLDGMLHDITAIPIKEDDKILHYDAEGISSTLSLKWVHTDKLDEIQLVGKENEVISKINVTDFLKNGMLQKVALDTTDPSNPILKFTFIYTESRTETIEVPVKDLIDTYIAGNGLTLENSIFSISVDPSGEPYLSVSENGLKISGIQSAIDTSVLNETNRAIAVEQGVLSRLENVESTIDDLYGPISNSGSIDSIVFNNLVGTTLDGVPENVHTKSLLRKYIQNGRPYVYASNQTSDIIHSGRTLDLIITDIENILYSVPDIDDGEITSILAVIRTLVDKVDALESEVATLKSTAITSINGTNNEIKVTRNDNNITIGFDDDAYFVAGD